MTKDEKIKLKCLELAIKVNDNGGTTWVIFTAREFEKYVKERDHGKSA